MKNLIYLTVVSLLVAVSAQAGDDPNDRDIQGAGVAVIGQECQTCMANTSNKPLQAKKSYDILLPDSGSSGSTGTSGAEGSR